VKKVAKVTWLTEPAVKSRRKSEETSDFVREENWAGNRAEIRVGQKVASIYYILKPLASVMNTIIIDYEVCKLYQLDDLSKFNT
jgi:hypothetical protein